MQSRTQQRTQTAPSKPAQSGASAPQQQQQSRLEQQAALMTRTVEAGLKQDKQAFAELALERAATLSQDKGKVKLPASLKDALPDPSVLLDLVRPLIQPKPGQGAPTQVERARASGGLALLAPWSGHFSDAQCRSLLEAAEVFAAQGPVGAAVRKVQPDAEDVRKITAASSSLRDMILVLRRFIVNRHSLTFEDFPCLSVLADFGALGYMTSQHRGAKIQLDNAKESPLFSREEIERVAPNAIRSTTRDVSNWASISLLRSYCRGRPLQCAYVEGQFPGIAILGGQRGRAPERSLGCVCALDLPVGVTPVIVADPASVESFVSGPISHEAGGLVGIDLEWFPTMGRLSFSPCALIQLAVMPAGATDPSQSHIYLLDVFTLSRDKTILYRALCALFCAPPAWRILGFGAHDDLAKLEHLCEGGPPKIRAGLSRVGELADDLCRAWPDMGNPSSLSKLILAFFGENLYKGAQTSDWCARPLRPEQVSYAALDAYCVILLSFFTTLHLTRASAKVVGGEPDAAPVER